VAGRRIEERHHTDEQVEQIIAKAADLVETLSLPEDLRVAAFTQAMGLYAAKQIVVEQIAPGLANMAIPRGV
jgi:hypothetical protein